jgi:large subunit ribosomal protein L21
VYAIFEDGGKQYKVSEGDRLLIELHDGVAPGQEITFDQVLLVGEGEDARVGQPFVSGARVTAAVVDQIRTPKVTGILFRRRKGLRKKYGHRQNMLHVEIKSISA